MVPTKEKWGKISTGARSARILPGGSIFTNFHVDFHHFHRGLLMAIARGPVLSLHARVAGSARSQCCTVAAAAAELLLLLLPAGLLLLLSCCCCCLGIGAALLCTVHARAHENT